MEYYKLNDVYWIFGLEQNILTREEKVVLRPFVFNENKTKIKLLDNEQIHIMSLDNTPTTNKDIVKYFYNYMHTRSATIQNSKFLYKVRLLHTPNFKLNKLEKEFIYFGENEYFLTSNLDDFLKNASLDKKQVLDLGKKFKKSLIKHIKKTAKNAKKSKFLDDHSLEL